MKAFMRALVHNLESPAEELRQVAASLLRNLSWKADYITKQILREVGTVALLAQVCRHPVPSLLSITLFETFCDHLFALIDDSEGGSRGDQRVDAEVNTVCAVEPDGPLRP
jgi:hypothetical protein